MDRYRVSIPRPSALIVGPCAGPVLPWADYGAAAARYVDVFMEAIRWDNAMKLFEQYGRES
jgi:hypothetical protein